MPTSDLYTPEERENSPTYTELMGRNDMQQGLHVRRDVPDGLQIVWALGESTDTRGWSSVQIGMIERLLPHIRHFASIRQALADAHALSNSLAELLDNTRAGIIQLDRKGRIVEASDQAARLLRGGSGLSDAGGVLRAEMPPDDARLQRLLAGALPSLGAQGSAGSTTVGRSESRSRLLLCVTPVSGRESDFRSVQHVAALVLVVDPERRPLIDRDLVAAALNLSPAENRLAVMLAAGHSVRDIVERTSWSENTVRWHLKRIFRKQGFASQADLVNRVLSLDGLPKPPL